MLNKVIEALIFAAAKGVGYPAIKEAFRDEYTEKEIKRALQEIKEEYSGDKGIILIQFNENFQFQTNPVYGEMLAEILRPIKERQLSSTVLQTLAIIAYRQPVTRAEIEHIRGGVSSDYAIGVLMKAELIEVCGRKDTIGKPALFATTDNFLKRFQLQSLNDLPDYNKLLEYVKNSDKYNRDTENLYRIDMEKETAATVSVENENYFFENIEEGMPKFLDNEDIVIIE